MQKGACPSPWERRGFCNLGGRQVQTCKSGHVTGCSRSGAQQGAAERNAPSRVAVQRNLPKLHFFFFCIKKIAKLQYLNPVFFNPGTSGWVWNCLSQNSQRAA